MNNLDLSQFNEKQLQQIQFGIEKNLDVSIYANPEYNSDQMEVIRLGLAWGLDVSKYANPKFDCDSMWEIEDGLSQNINVDIYADPKFNAKQMEQIKLGLIDNKYTSPKIDVDIYADPKFDYKQMAKIRWGLNTEVDVSKYATPEFDANQMDEILTGLNYKINVDIYANPKFNASQMNKIKLELMNNKKEKECHCKHCTCKKELHLNGKFNMDEFVKFLKDSPVEDIPHIAIEGTGEPSFYNEGDTIKVYDKIINLKKILGWEENKSYYLDEENKFYKIKDNSLYEKYNLENDYSFKLISEKYNENLFNKLKKAVRKDYSE